MLNWTSIDCSEWSTILDITPQISTMASRCDADRSAVVFSMLAIYALITNPMLLFVMVWQTPRNKLTADYCRRRCICYWTSQWTKPPHRISRHLNLPIIHWYSRFPSGVDLTRIVRRFRPSFLHRESHDNWYSLRLRSLTSRIMACRSKLCCHWRTRKFILNWQKSFRACRNDGLVTCGGDYLWTRSVMVDTVDLLYTLFCLLDWIN